MKTLKIKNRIASHGLPIMGVIIAGMTLAGGVAFAQTGPVISSIGASPTTNGASITWTTNQGANAQVLYGTSSNSVTPYTASTTPTTGFASTTQSVALTGLNPNTEYFYTVKSGNASGTFTTSTEQTFMTTALMGTLSANPASGTPGSSFSLSGSGFGNSEFVNLNFNGATSSANANASGTFTTTLTVPSTTVSTNTAETIMATGGTSGTMASTTFTVIPAAVTPTPSSSISLNPTSGMAGGTFTVTGMNFQPNETVMLTFNGATSTAQANASGTFTSTITVPGNAASGSSKVSVTGNTSGMTASQWFTIQAAPPSNSSSTPDLTTLQNEIVHLQNLVNQLIAEVQQLLGSSGNNNGGNNNGGGSGSPSSTLSATIDQVGSIRAGTSVDFTGRNWGTDERVRVSANGNTVTTAQADGGGNFSTGSIPVSSTPGSETYTFTGLTTGLTRTVTITLTL